MLSIDHLKCGEKYMSIILQNIWTNILIKSFLVTFTELYLDPDIEEIDFFKKYIS